MDDDVLAAVAGRVGVGAAEAVDQLAAAVRGTLWLDRAGDSVFQEHVERLRAWRAKAKVARDRRDEVGFPPAVALLAVLTLAAEAMEGDAGHAAHAYYPRLCELLQVSDAAARHRLESAYRRHAELLWSSLNEWLSAADGKYGLPTAYALSHRYIGLPISQALVRTADRRRLPQMFRQLGLPPGSEVSPGDMVPLIEAWIRQNPCPASKSMQSLWSRPAARERIASVAAVELSLWDGSGGAPDDDGVEQVGEILVVALLRRFPRAQLELSFLADLRSSIPPRTLTALSAPGRPELEMVPVDGRRVRPRGAAAVDPGSLVQGMLQLRDPASGKEASRRPRRVVPLRHDELLNAYVESERVQLGEDVLLLVKDDAALRQDVTQSLRQVARPGFQEHVSLPGLPEGWVVVTDVQVFASLPAEPTRSDLNALVPLLSSQLALAGGLRLPGRVRKWSSLRPPEVRAVVQEARTLQLTMTPLGNAEGAGAKTRSWVSQQPSLVVELSEQNLPDGDYELSLARNGRVVQHATLRLRSSETPDAFSWESAPRLVHDLSRPLTVLTADVWDNETGPVVDGPWAPKADESVRVPVRAGRTMWWTAPKPAGDSSPLPVVVTTPDPASCIVTGAHRIQLPTYYGRPRAALVTGVCTTCGLVKRYPAWYSERRIAAWSLTRGRTPTVPQVDVHRLPPVESDDVGWGDALDALIHVGGGGFGWLERVALQVEGSTLFVDSFSRALEALGHVEVRRGTMLAPEEWNVTSPRLAELADGSLLLTGAWTPTDRRRLGEQVEALGGTMRCRRTADAPPTWVVSGLDRAAAVAAAEGVRVAGPVPDAARRLLRAVPPLGAVARALPRIPMPAAPQVTRFHPPSASWVPVASATAAGAYRLLSATSTTNVFRAGEDLDRGEAAVGTVQLVKHLEARRLGHPLVAYDRDARRLAVPLGADLPGLFGRAAVLCSGQLPTPVPERRCLVYKDVPADVADLLVAVLSD